MTWPGLRRRGRTGAAAPTDPDCDATGDGEGAGNTARSVPEPGGEGERAAAHRVVAALEALMAPHVAECHRLVEPPPGTRRPFRRLTTLFH